LFLFVRARMVLTPFFSNQNTGFELDLLFAMPPPFNPPLFFLSLINPFPPCILSRLALPLCYRACLMCSFPFHVFVFLCFLLLFAFLFVFPFSSLCRRAYFSSGRDNFSHSSCRLHHLSRSVYHILALISPFSRVNGIAFFLPLQVFFVFFSSHDSPACPPACVISISVWYTCVGSFSKATMVFWVVLSEPRFLPFFSGLALSFDYQGVASISIPLCFRSVPPWRGTTLFCFTPKTTLSLSFQQPLPPLLPPPKKFCLGKLSDPQL